METVVLIWEVQGFSGSSLVAQMIKNPPAMQETQVQSLGWEDPLEQEMASHSNTFAWRIPWAEETGELQSMGLRRVGCIHTHTVILQETSSLEIVMALGLFCLQGTRGMLLFNSVTHAAWDEHRQK